MGTSEWLTLGLSIVGLLGGLLVAMVKAGIVLGTVHAKLDNLCERNDERFGHVEGRVERIETHIWKGNEWPTPKGN